MFIVNRYIFLGFIVLFTVSPVASEDWSLVVENSRSYGENVGMGVVCADGSCNPPVQDNTLCGKTDNWDALSTGTWWHNAGNSGTIWLPNDRISGSSYRIKVPRDYPCGITPEADFDGQNLEGKLSAVNMADPNKASYMLIRTQQDDPKNLYNFVLTKDSWYGEDVDPYGLIFASEASGVSDAPDNAVLEPQYGQIWGNDHLQRATMAFTVYNGRVSTGQGEDKIIELSNQNFGLGTDFGNSPCTISTTVSVNDHSFSSCSPLHQDGVYRPDGEIIRATNPTKGSFYPSSSLGRSDETNLYVCRGDYMGDSIEDSKLVKVQKYPEGDLDNPEWLYYRCNMDGEWVQDVCEPGLKLVNRGSPGSPDYECQEKDPRMVDVQFLNISGIPESVEGDGYVAGFYIESSEMDKYKETMGYYPQRIDAECWMGEDDQRPSIANPSQYTAFSAYGGSGSHWVLDKIPWREGVDNSTYSCIYGFRNDEMTETVNFMESTRNPPLRSRDGGFKQVDYGNIGSIRARDAPDGSFWRGQWTHYRSKSTGGKDNRSYVNEDEEWMQGPPFEEVPYCNTPGEFNILKYVICK